MLKNVRSYAGPRRRRGVVANPPTGDTAADTEIESAHTEVSIGTTAWRPTPEPEVVEGRFVSSLLERPKKLNQY